MTSSTGQLHVVQKPASFCVFSTWLLLASFDAHLFFIIHPVAPLPPWRILAKLAVLHMKDVPVFCPTADVQGPEEHPKDDAAKHFLALASRKQEATATCIEQLCWATTAAREVHIGHQKKFLHHKEHATLEQIDQTGCGIAILGGFQHSARKSHSWPDLVLAILLLQVEGWTGWPAEVSSQPIFLWFFTCTEDASKIRISVEVKRYSLFCFLLIS